MKPITSKIRRSLFAVLLGGTLVSLTFAYICGITAAVSQTGQPSPDPYLFVAALGVMGMLTLHVLPFGRILDDAMEDARSTGGRLAQQG